MRLPARTLLAAALLPLLAGCINDTTSYVIGGDLNHAIIMTRSQNWFWEHKVDVSVVVTRMPHCSGGLEIKGVPSNRPMVLHQAPNEYPEPIYILDAGGSQYAVSTESCRVQKFAEKPADEGPVIGRFETVKRKFQFVPANKK